MLFINKSIFYFEENIMSRNLEQNAVNQTEYTNQKLWYLYETYQGFVQNYSMKIFQGITRENFENNFWTRIQKMIGEGKFDNVKNEKSYLRDIMKKVYYELLRKKENQIKMIDITYLSAILPSNINDPGEIISNKELAEDIIKYAETLNQPLTTIFTYYYKDGRNTRWISEKMGINRSTIRGYLRIIRLSIKERFKNCF